MQPPSLIFISIGAQNSGFVSVVESPPKPDWNGKQDVAAVAEIGRRRWNRTDAPGERNGLCVERSIARTSGEASRKNPT